MTPDALVSLAEGTLYLALRLALPLLGACVLASIVVSMFQASTQANDPSVSLTAKLVLVAGAVVLGQAFFTSELVHFSTEVWSRIAEVAR